MKHETKLRIIAWVKRLLNYDPTRNLPFKIEVETKKIVIIKSQHVYSERELLMISDAQVKFAHGMQLITELEKIRAIEYKYIGQHDQRPFTAHVQSTATLLIILPKNDTRRERPVSD